jgi:hypothetical protein
VILAKSFKLILDPTVAIFEGRLGGGGINERLHKNNSNECLFISGAAYKDKPDMS